MPDIEHELRKLREKVDKSVRVRPGAARAVVRRSRVIRAATGAAVLGVVLALAVGGLFGGRALLSIRPQEGGPPPRPAAAPTDPCRGFEQVEPEGRQNRRQADIAREQCEERLRQQQKNEEEEEAPCARDTERRDVPPPDDPSLVGVYFSCVEDIAAKEHPLYLFTEGVSPDSDVRKRLESALGRYLEGPTSKQKRRGYLAGFPTPVSEGLKRVSMEGGAAVVEFDRALEVAWSHTGGSSATLAAIEEVRAIAFQFEEVESLQLQVEGECDRFWRLIEMSCRTLTRKG